MGKKELIFVYSTGRSGTAYLAQVFGQEPWRKNMIARPQQGIVITHEHLNITHSSFSAMKDVNQKAKENVDIQKIYVQKLLGNYNVEKKMFITANAFGRFCGYFIVKFHKNYKCIYIEREKEDFVNSTIRRLDNFLCVYGKKHFDHYIRQRFNTTSFSPLDCDTIIKMSEKEWDELPLEEKFRWNWQETKERWKKFKIEMDQNRYIETTYENILKEEGLDEISNFIGLPYSKELMNVRVNQSEKY